MIGDVGRTSDRRLHVRSAASFKLVINYKSENGTTNGNQWLIDMAIMTWSGSKCVPIQFLIILLMSISMSSTALKYSIILNHIALICLNHQKKHFIVKINHTKTNKANVQQFNIK